MGRTPSELLRAAWQRRGRERDRALAVVKAVAATLLSYSFAVLVLDSQTPAFAPFAAIFVVQATVYRSVLHGLRYVGAVVLGVVAAGAIGMTLGQTFWTLALLVFVSVLLGQWRRFGGYGPQIALIGLFAFAAGGGDESNYLIDLLLTVVSGSLAGLAVNILLAPPLRFQDTASGLTDVSGAIRDLLLDMAETLRGDDPLGKANSWRRRSHELVGLVDRVRNDVDFREEQYWLHPRRLTYLIPYLAEQSSGSDTTLTTYRTVTSTLAAQADHVESIARALAYADRPDGDGPGETLLADFLPAYADLLEVAADAVAEFGHIPIGDGEHPSDLVQRGYELHGELSRRISAAEPGDPRVMADCGAMLVGAERLLGELETRPE